MSDITVVSDLRPSFGQVRDQGSRPTCLAFAVSDTHAVHRDGWHALSCEYVFYYAQLRARLSSHRGSRLSAMLEALHEEGQPKEEGWPYLEAVPTHELDWQPPADVGSVYRRDSIQVPVNINAIIDTLNQEVPVIVLMYLSPSFFVPGEYALIDARPDESPEWSQRHAVIAVGHGTLGSQRVVLVRNSWSLEWGNQGYSWLTENYLAPRLFALATLTEVVNVPLPSITA